MDFKELLKDERSRKIVLLFLYLFMMTIIVLIVRINPGKANTTYRATKIDEVIVDNVSGIDKLKYTNYQYQYNIVSGESNYTIDGIRYNDEELFNYNNKKYLLKKNVIYEIDGYKMLGTEASSEFFYKLRSEKIYDLIVNNIPILELEVDGEMIKEYNLVDENSQNFVIKTYEKNNYINKIELTYEYGSSITITYSNVNKVSKLNTNFEEE